MVLLVRSSQKRVGRVPACWRVGGWLWLPCGSEWGVLVNAACVKVVVVVVLWGVSGCGVVVSAACW